MKKILISIGITVFCVSFVYAHDTLLMSAPPSIWAQEEGTKLTGPIVELATKIFFEFNVPVKAVCLPWARAMEDMRNGELDVILAIFHTKEREEFMDFTIPYAEVPVSVFVPKGKSFPFKTLGDLMGRKGLVVRGDSLGIEFDKIAHKLNLYDVPHVANLIRMLDRGRADYAVYAKYAFLVEARKMGYADKIEALSVPVDSRNLHFAFSKKSPFLKYLPKTNDKIEEMKNDKPIEKMIEKAIISAAGR